MSTAMASLQGLPPLPKSLSALLNFSSSQWKELERLHAMRTMIQQDLNRGSTTLDRLGLPQQHLSELEQGIQASEQSILQSSEPLTPGTASNLERRPSAKSRLDAQLALLRKEMVGLRQLDMSLLCQLWSLNESIQEYKHLLHDGMMVAASSSSPGWDNGLLMDYSDDAFSNPRQSGFHLDRPRPHRGRSQRGDLSSVPERLSSDSSSDNSSFEFGDI